MNKLAEVAQINEEIKRIIALADGIGLTATKAMLETQQTDTGSLGFSMVVQETRVLGRRMAYVMQGLSRLTCRLVNRTAQEYMRAQRVRCLCAAGGRSGGALEFIAESCEESRRQLGIAGLQVSTLTRELMAELGHIEKQCIVGMAVGRLARIEASYGGARQRTLHQISKSVDAIIADILDRVCGLEVRLQEFAA